MNISDTLFGDNRCNIYIKQIIYTNYINHKFLDNENNIPFGICVLISYS